MTQQPLVSTVISTYNGAKYIRKAIDSVLNQTYKNIELIIADDCSTDDTQKIISEYLKKDPRIRTFRNETNMGSYKSLNKAIGVSKGKYIANLDDDDIWITPKKIEKQVEFMEKNKDYGLVGGGMIKIDTKNNEIARFLFLENDEDLRKSILSANNLFAHSSVLFRKDIWEKAGGYNGLFDYSADMDLWLKMGKLSKMHNLREYLINYLEKEGSEIFFSRKNSARRKVWLNIKMRNQYKYDYSGYKKAIFLCWASYFYSFLPYKYKQKIRFSLIKLRALILGLPISRHEK